MKAILEFDMYEDKEAFETYYKAIDYLDIITEFDYWIRRRSDNTDPLSLDEVKAAWSKIKEDNLS
jgi:hypothetical protein